MKIKIKGKCNDIGKLNMLLQLKPEARHLARLENKLIYVEITTPELKAKDFYHMLYLRFTRKDGTDKVFNALKAIEV